MSVAEPILDATFVSISAVILRCALRSTEVILDASQATVQFKALLAEYFKEFQAVRNGKKLRQDPQGAGPPYRNNIGIPGGYRGSLFPLIKAAVPLGLTLVEGKGASDTNDEYQVYIYDTAKFKVGTVPSETTSKCCHANFVFPAVLQRGTISPVPPECCARSLRSRFLHCRPQEGASGSRAN